MAGGGARSDRKSSYFARFTEYLKTYSRILIVEADFVGSAHMQDIRISLRGKAVLSMGKNSLMRKVIRTLGEEDPKYLALLPIISGNVGFVFTNCELSEIKPFLSENVVDAPAKAGVIAPCDVKVPGGLTGMEPTMTSFFQALNIPTKITKGQIEIINEIQLIRKGFKVGTSEAALLQKLNVKPFTYGLKITNVYDDGAVFKAAVLDLTDDDIVASFKSGVSMLAALSLQLHYPTVAALPHLIAAGYKNVLAVCVTCETYSFPKADKVREFIANPELAAAAAAAAAPAAGSAPAAAAAAPVEEEEEEEEEEAAFDLFD